MTSPQHSRRLYRRLAADVNALDLPSGPATAEPVSQAQLSGLPATGLVLHGSPHRQVPAAARAALAAV